MPNLRHLSTRLLFVLKNKLFAATVVIPFVLVTFYYVAIASDIYVSESKFILRVQQRQGGSALGSLLQGTALSGLTKTTDDAYAVAEYIESRDAMRYVDTRMPLRGVFGDGAIDRVARFAGLDGDQSNEALFKYFGRHVVPSLDMSSSIITLTVRAFQGPQAQALNEYLLQAAEQLVNQLNERAHRDAVASAQAAVTAAEQRAQAAETALAGYRNKHLVMDPERQSALELDKLARLQQELLLIQTQISQLKASAPESPQLQWLGAKAATLQSAIATAQNGIAGQQSSLAGLARTYSSVQLEREFAQRQYASALASLEQARLEAKNNRVYLDRIEQPSLPDASYEPRRLHHVLATLGLGLLAFAVLSLMANAVKEHTL